MCSVKKGPSSASGGSTPLSYHGLARTQTKGQTKGQAGGGGGGSLKLLWLTRRFSPHFHHELLQQVRCTENKERGGEGEMGQQWGMEGVWVLQCLWPDDDVCFEDYVFVRCML